MIPICGKTTFFEEPSSSMSQEISTPANATFQSLMREDRLFPPPAEFSAKARIKSEAEYEAMYSRSIDQPEAFWTEAASELEWFTPWTQVMDGSGAHAKWFTGGKLNLSHNCVDRHALGANKDKVALIWEGEPQVEGKPVIRKLTFAELHIEIQKFANVLKSLKVKKGDRIAIYMGMSPELAIAVLACARIGAVHSVIFGGFAAHAIADRVADSDCQIVLTQDISYRRGSEIKLKAIVDEAMITCPNVRNVGLSARGEEQSRHGSGTRSLVA
jgi:acetyl-CoA synthetase